MLPLSNDAKMGKIKIKGKREKRSSSVNKLSAFKMPFYSVMIESRIDYLSSLVC